MHTLYGYNFSDIYEETGKKNEVLPSYYTVYMLNKCYSCTREDGLLYTCRLLLSIGLSTFSLGSCGSPLTNFPSWTDIRWILSSFSRHVSGKCHCCAIITRFIFVSADLYQGYRQKSVLIVTTWPIKKWLVFTCLV